MKSDAVFYKRNDDGFWTGKTRRGALVKIRSTPQIDKAIEDAWGNVVTVELSESDNDKGMLGNVVEVCLSSTYWGSK